MEERSARERARQAERLAGEITDKLARNALLQMAGELYEQALREEADRDRRLKS
jgi:hypothetical protein